MTEDEIASMAWTDVTSAFSNVAIAVSAAAGAWAACSGVSGWKRELRGKVEYGLARRTLRTVYRIRDRVDRFRAALDDITFGVPDPNERLKSLNEQCCRLDALLVEAEVIWGNHLSNDKQLMRQFLTELYRLARAARRRVPQAPSGRPDPHKAPREILQDAQEKLRPRDADEPDPLRDTMKNTVEAFEAALRPVFGDGSGCGGRMPGLMERWRIRRCTTRPPK